MQSLRGLVDTVKVNKLMLSSEKQPEESPIRPRSNYLDASTGGNTPGSTAITTPSPFKVPNRTPRRLTPRRLTPSRLSPRREGFVEFFGGQGEFSKEPPKKDEMVNSNKGDSFDIFGGQGGFAKDNDSDLRTPQDPREESDGFDFFGGAGFSMQSPNDQGGPAFGGFNFNAFNKSPEADDSNDGQSFLRFNF